MDINTFVVTVYCFVDDWLKGKRLRQRGPQPKLSDSEVLTMEIVGEFLGIDTEVELYRHFRWHWGDWFPRLCEVNRTTLTRQMANLWRVKEQLWQALLEQITYDPEMAFVDSFPVPVCRLARAYRCRNLPELATYGYDDMERQTFYGLRAHARVCYPGVIVALELAPANVHDTAVAEDLTEGMHGTLLGDRNYWAPKLAARLHDQAVTLVAPFKWARREPQPFPHTTTQFRRRIETVFAQLVQRFHAKRVWARDPWHLSSRWLRKILAHTFAVFACQQAGLPSSLAFAQLLQF
ncbi:MAG: IS982 family transposase [Anaerolineae bacterium]|nr:IS982 family transposase [Anaerolineae bacterium]